MTESIGTAKSLELAILKSRLLINGSGPDARLKQPPFSTHPVQYIVHRHRLRQRLAFQIARNEARTLRTPLFIASAVDDIHKDSLDKGNVIAIKEALLNLCNLTETMRVK